MTKIKIITSLLDESVILEKIAKDLPFPFNRIMQYKAENLNTKLVQILLNPYQKTSEMDTIKIINSLQDELAIIELITKDLPITYARIMNHKIEKINSFLSEINSIETEKNNADLQYYASDLLIELEAQEFEESEESEIIIRERFNGKIIETPTYNSQKN